MVADDVPASSAERPAVGGLVRRRDGRRPPKAAWLAAIAIAIAIVGGCTLSPATTGSGAAGSESCRPPGPLYGTGLNGDSKSDRTIAPGQNVVRHAIRWRASTSSELEAVVLQWRTSADDPAYSGGDLGTYRISVQTDDGSNEHVPSGDILAETTVALGEIRGTSDGSAIRRHPFGSPARLTQGRVYHLVIENVSAHPEVDYASLNHLFTFEELQPRQPLFADLDLAVLGSQRARGRDWAVDSHHTPNVDFEYADGVHDGQAYLNNRRDQYALIGGDDQLRERFTVCGGDRIATSMWVRVNHQSGDGLLTLHLDDADGVEIEGHQIVGSASVNDWVLGSDADTGDWIGVTLDEPRLLEDGRVYSVRITGPPDTTYAMVNLLARDRTDIDGEYMRSFRFSDGRTERSRDGGRSWMLADPSWASYSNMQFYLETPTATSTSATPSGS